MTISTNSVNPDYQKIKPATLPPLVILDRDGVINHDSDAYIKSVDEWVPIDGSIEAIGRLCRSGIKVAVATNQSGLARGLFDENILGLIHDKMRGAIRGAGGALAGVFYCPHGPEEGCNCRKPGIGLITQIAKQLQIDPRGVPLVGDALRDLQAASTAGCQPVLVKTGKGRITLGSSLLDPAIPVFDDLSAFVDFWLS